MCCVNLGKVFFCTAKWFEEELLVNPWNKTATATAENLREQMSSSPGFPRPSYLTGETSNVFKSLQEPVFIG